MNSGSYLILDLRVGRRLQHVHQHVRSPDLNAPAFVQHFAGMKHAVHRSVRDARTVAVIGENACSVELQFGEVVAREKIRHTLENGCFTDSLKHRQDDVSDLVPLTRASKYLAHGKYFCQRSATAQSMLGIIRIEPA